MEQRKKLTISFISGSLILGVLITIFIYGNFGGYSSSPHNQGPNVYNPKSTGQVQAKSGIFPEEILGIPLVAYFEGEEAIARLAMLHGTKVDTKEGYEVHYQNNDKVIVIWISVDPEEKAQELFNIMDTKIATRRTPFTDRTEINFKEKKAIFVKGMGQDHYYWVQGEENFWVALGGFDNSQEAMTQLFEILRDR